MRKALLAILALLLLLTSCHGNLAHERFSMPEGGFDESRQYNITFWAKNDTNKTQVSIYEKAIADFQALYPNITVNLRLYTDYGKIYNDVITNIATDTTPNVCITYPDHIATYLTGDETVVQLDQLMADPEYGLGGSKVRFDAPSKGEIVPQFLEECVFNGYTYALPFMRSTEALYINSTFVEALGYSVPDIVTWPWIWEVSEAAMAKNEDGTFKLNGQNVLIPFIYKSTDNMMIQMLHQLGAGYSKDDGSIQLFNDDTRAILKEIALHATSGAFSTFKISSYPANFLNAGQCIFAIDSTAGATWMGSDAPLLDISPDKIVHFQTVVRPVPQYDANNISMISQGPSVCVFNKRDPQEVLASWLFVQFLLTNDVQNAYAGTEGYAPVTLKAQSSQQYQTYLALGGKDNNEHYGVKIDATRLLLDNTDRTFTSSVFNGSASLRDAAGQLIEEVTKAVKRSKVVDDDFIEAQFSNVTSLYRLNLNGGSTSGNAAKQPLGELASASKTLLWILGCTWVVLGAIVIGAKLSKKSKESKHK